MAALTRTAYPKHSSVEDGRLVIGGCDAVELAEQYGTPAYVISVDDLRDRAFEFKDALREGHQGDAQVVFASKSLPVTAVMREFNTLGLYIDVASGGELHMAREAGYAANRIVVHGNAKSAAELRTVLELGLTHLVVDNFDELERIEELAIPEKWRVGILVRVTPDVEIDSHHAVVTGKADSKFGFSLEQAAQVIDRHRHGDLIWVAGLHMHIGSQIFDPEPYRKAMQALATLGEFTTYDIGGGFGATYTEADPQIDLKPIVTEIASAADEILGAAGKRLMIEPGRSLVANAGVTLYSVESTKTNVRDWISVDGGMSDNLRPMLYGAVYDADVANRMRAHPDDGEVHTIAGKHCESGDVLVRDVRLREPKVGDIIVTPTTGAYGHALANNYNGVPRPPVIFVKDGKSAVVLRRETYADLTKRDVWRDVRF